MRARETDSDSESESERERERERLATGFVKISLGSEQIVEADVTNFENKNKIQQKKQKFQMIDSSIVKRKQNLDQQKTKATLSIQPENK